METTLTLPDSLALIASMLPLYGAILLHMRALRADMNQRFDDAQRPTIRPTPTSARTSRASNAGSTTSNGTSTAD